MLYYIFYSLRDLWFGFNVFKYITFRAAMAAVTAFFLTLILAPWVIRWLTELKMGQHIRQEEEVRGLYHLHSHKHGIPTMGGLLILLALLGSSFLWGAFLNLKLLLAMGVTVAFGAIGFWDDLLKVRRENSKGLSSRAKLFWQGTVSVAFLTILLLDVTYPTSLEIPFVKNSIVNLAHWYMPFAFLVLVGTTNAVNLTDGLDGLAIGCTILIGLTLTVLTYLTGHKILADYLLIPFIPGAGELTIFCAALVGASMGFLWYNAPPANVFMGDVGSLAIGGAIGSVAVLIKKELLLVIIGGIFVMETLSVILQVASFKLTGRRIFLMTPIHHHFQLIGWPESKVTIRFWIIGAVLALISLSTLKLR
ncbi:MAG: phospho-N-acetylmuramoyl-pentapeptide-transferase [Candidatus Omnitrophica bacterium]|nr:phospho-N-acetylmuramoyl-pentapeptide-transferase [Candidatus Omnitrophota bacterium]